MNDGENFYTPTDVLVHARDVGDRAVMLLQQVLTGGLDPVWFEDADDVVTDWAGISAEAEALPREGTWP